MAQKTGAGTWPAPHTWDDLSASATSREGGSPRLTVMVVMVVAVVVIAPRPALTLVMMVVVIATLALEEGMFAFLRCGELHELGRCDLLLLNFEQPVPSEMLVNPFPLFKQVS